MVCPWRPGEKMDPVLDLSIYREHLIRQGFTLEQAEAYAVVVAEICLATSAGRDFDLYEAIKLLAEAEVSNVGHWIGCATGFFRPPIPADFRP